jgi:flagellar hook-length control protein FliK
MQLSPTGKIAGMTTSTTPGSDEPVKDFDALLAALLSAPEASADRMIAGLPAAAELGTEAATTGDLPAAADPDDVAALLASLPDTHPLCMTPAAAADAGLLGAGVAGEFALGTRDAHALTSVAALTAGAPNQPQQANGRAAAAAAMEALPDPSTRTPMTDAGDAAAALGETLAGKAQDRLPLADGLPAAARRPEREAGLAETPALAAAELRASFAATELPARQTVLPVAPALSSPAWNQAFSEQVLWAARAELQSASLTLNPPELGPVTIELQLDDTQATASFGSTQPEVRKAIEDALPALKTLFAEAGLDLRQADVGSGDAQSRQSRNLQDSQDRGHDNRTSGRASDAAPNQAAPDPAAPAAARQSHRLLDTFA